MSTKKSASKTPVLTPQKVETNEPIAAPLLAQLRMQNSHIDLIKSGMQASIGGYIAGRGFSLDTHDIEFNIDTGVMHVKQK